MARSIFITGGASGIGLAVAKRFAGEGWRVGLADVNEAALDAAKRQVAGASGHAMDVRDRAAWARELAEFAGGGGIDVVFNNAGIASGGAFVDTPDAEIDRVVEINFMGVVNGARAAYPFLKGRPGACLLNTASAAGIYGTAGAAIYSATKFAVRGLTEALDGEWRSDGIKVRSLMPSFIETPLLDAGVTGSNQNVRQRVLAAGLELTPVSEVADAAWAAVLGDAVHMVVGKTARRMRFAARWMPGSLRRQMGLERG